MTLRLLAYLITPRCLLLTNNASRAYLFAPDLLLLRVLLLLLAAGGHCFGGSFDPTPTPKSHRCWARQGCLPQYIWIDQPILLTQPPQTAIRKKYL
jgi:hypothetical protein